MYDKKIVERVNNKKCVYKKSRKNKFKKIKNKM